MIFTRCEGTQGCAVTKLMSLVREYVYSLVSSRSRSVTAKVKAAAYLRIGGGRLSPLTSDAGVVSYSSVGVVWTEPAGATRLRAFRSISRMGGALSW